MKGTEKQIAWAEDIKRTTIDTCKNNIERMNGEALFEANVDAYKIMLAVIDKIIEINADKDAAWWIDHRNTIASQRINSTADNWASQIRSGRKTAQQIAEQNGVRI